MMKQKLLDERTKFVMQYQRKNVIELSSDEDSNPNQPSYSSKNPFPAMIPGNSEQTELINLKRRKNSKMHMFES
jgi:hypothetical protein